MELFYRPNGLDDAPELTRPGKILFSSILILTAAAGAVAEHEVEYVHSAMQTVGPAFKAKADETLQRAVPSGGNEALIREFGAKTGAVVTDADGKVSIPETIAAVDGIIADTETWKGSGLYTVRYDTLVRLNEWSGGRIHTAKSDPIEAIQVLLDKVQTLQPEQARF